MDIQIKGLTKIYGAGRRWQHFAERAGGGLPLCAFGRPVQRILSRNLRFPHDRRAGGK